MDEINQSYEAALATLPDRDTDGVFFGSINDVKLHENQRRRANSSWQPKTMTTKQWRQTIGYFGNRCAYCHRECYKFHIEHVSPLSNPTKAGHVAINVVPACADCNLRKHHRNLIECLIAGVFNA